MLLVFNKIGSSSCLTGIWRVSEMAPNPAVLPGMMLLQFHNLCSRNVRELVLNAPFSKNNNLSIIKEGFVCLFCFVCHTEIPQTNTSLLCVLLVLLESPCWYIKGSLRWFGSILDPWCKVQELLNIEQFGQTKFNKIKTKYFREFWKLKSIS
jgi:hypothetical protein